MKLALLFVALVAFAATAQGQQQCVINAVNEVVNCVKIESQSGNLDALCNCMAEYVNDIENCVDYCLYGDNYEQLAATYCGANSGNFDQCFKAICDVVDNCDGGNVPSNSFNYYWDVIICYYWNEVVCGLVDLYASLITYAPLVTPVLEGVCDEYTDYCNDIGFNTRGGVAVKSTKARMQNYESQDALNNKRNELFNDIESGFTFGGGKGGIEKAVEADCNNCQNQCNDCSLLGDRWLAVKEGECHEFNNCPEDDSDDVNIKTRTYVKFYNDIPNSETQKFGIDQKWEFSGEFFGIGTPSIDCTVTYGGTYNFYSDAVTCATRVFLNDIDLCDNNCDDNEFLNDDLKAMMCSNFPLVETIDDTIFSNSCKDLSYQQTSYTRNNSAGLLVPSVALIAAVVALLY